MGSELEGSSRFINGMKKGFTLLEIVIVIVILGVLVAMALPVMYHAVNKAKIAEVMSNFSQIRSRVEAELMNNNYSFVGVDKLEWLNELVIYVQQYDSSPGARFNYQFSPMTGREYIIFATLKGHVASDETIAMHVHQDGTVDYCGSDSFSSVGPLSNCAPD